MPHRYTRIARDLIKECEKKKIILYAKGKSLMVKLPTRKACNDAVSTREMQHFLLALDSLEADVIEQLRAGHKAYIPKCMVCKATKTQIDGRIPRCQRCDR